MLLDSDYYLILLPAILLWFWALLRIASARRTAGRVQSWSGMTGAEAARAVMRAGATVTVEIEQASGQLADYYDSSRKVLRLSAAVESGRSLAAMGIAAHEAGHVLQHRAHAPGLLLRSLVVPFAPLGSTAYWLLFLAGLCLGIFPLVVWSTLTLWFTMILELANLPVEIDASRRARQALFAAGLVAPGEVILIDRVLNSMAWTHVATAFTGAWSPILGLVAARLRRVRGRIENGAKNLAEAPRKVQVAPHP